MSTKQLMGLIGSLLLLLGVFCPLVTVPIAGSMNYFQNGEGDGIVIILLALASIGLVLTNNFKHLWITGLSSLGVMAFTFFNFYSKLNQITQQLNKQLAGNPFKGLSDAAIQSIQLQWGWALMLIGVILILMAAWQSQNIPISEEPILDNSAKKCPICAEIIKFEAIKCRFCGHDFDENKVANSEQEQPIDIAIPLRKDDYVAECPTCQAWSSHLDWCSHCQKPFHIEGETQSENSEASHDIETETLKSHVSTANSDTHESFGTHDRQCPKCGYERQLKDDEVFPLYECPRCQIVYEKYLNSKPYHKTKSETEIYEPSSINSIIHFVKKPLDMTVAIVVCLIAILFAASYLYAKGLKPYFEVRKLQEAKRAEWDKAIKEGEKYKAFQIKTPEELAKLVNSGSPQTNAGKSNLKLDMNGEASVIKSRGVIEMNFTITNQNTYNVKDIIISCTYKDTKKVSLLENKKTINDVIKGNSGKTFKNVDMGYFHPQTVTASCGIVDSKFAP